MNGMEFNREKYKMGPKSGRLKNRIGENLASQYCMRKTLGRKIGEESINSVM